MTKLRLRESKERQPPFNSRSCSFQTISPESKLALLGAGTYNVSEENTGASFRMTRIGIVAFQPPVHTETAFKLT